MPSDLRARIIAVLPRRTSGRLVGAIAADLRSEVTPVHVELMAMEKDGSALSRARHGQQRWYLGPAALPSTVPREVGPEPQGLF